MSGAQIIHDLSQVEVQMRDVVDEVPSAWTVGAVSPVTYAQFIQEIEASSDDD